jgi:hypothetical protein
MVGLVVLGVLLALWVFWGWPTLLAHQIGKRKAVENAWIWGFALSWIGTIIVMSQPPPLEPPVLHPHTGSLPALKRCPRCAEDVKVAARVCRFCGHSFSVSAELK